MLPSSVRTCARHTWRLSHRCSGSCLSLTRKRCHPASHEEPSPRLPSATASCSAPEAELGETGVRRPRPLLSPQLHSALLPGRPLGSSETPLLGTSNPRDLKPRGRKGRSQKGLVASPRRGVQLTSSQGCPENSASPVTSSDVQPQGETPGKGKPKRCAVPCLRPGGAWVASSGCGVRRGSASTEGGPGPPGPRPLTCGSCPPSSGGRAGPSC